MSVLAIDGTTYGVNLHAHPGAPSLSRQFITQLCDLWGVAEDTTEKALLLVSELVTNAAHATARLTGPNWGRYVVVRARITTSELRVEVLDHSPDMPVVQQSDAHSESGRGLILVNELADEWGCHPAVKFLAHLGKAVWFTVKLSKPPQPRNARPEAKPLDPDEVIPATSPATARPSPRPVTYAQQAEMHFALPQRGEHRPAARPQARPSIPSRQPAPSAYATNTAVVERLQATLLGLRIEVA